MPRTPNVPNLYDALAERRDRLRQDLTRLASAKFAFVRHESRDTDDDLPRAIITSSVRVRGTNFLFSIWEDFRDSDGTPLLYGFTYKLDIQTPHNPEPATLFRYECHPDVDDRPEEGEEADPEEDEEKPWAKRNPYGVHPHFHPHKIIDYPVSRLHYPFHRSERLGVVFALISWIETDLVVRFYESGRVKAVS